MIDQKEASHRLDALTRAITALRDSADRFELEANALRAIIEAEPKKEPRGLCWVWDNNRAIYSRANAKIRPINKTRTSGGFSDDNGVGWDNATPLTESELQAYRGRWE